MGQFFLWILPIWAWGVDVCLNLVSDSIAGAAGMKSPWIWLFAFGVAGLITLGLNRLSHWLAQRKWGEARDISHLKTARPIASKRELEASEIIGKTILIESLINQDNMVVDKEFIRCEIVGPAVILSDHEWP